MHLHLIEKFSFIKNETKTKWHTDEIKHQVFHFQPFIWLHITHFCRKKILKGFVTSTISFDSILAILPLIKYHYDLVKKKTIILFIRQFFYWLHKFILETLLLIFVPFLRKFTRSRLIFFSEGYNLPAVLIQFIFFILTALCTTFMRKYGFFGEVWLDNGLFLCIGRLKTKVKAKIKR